MNVITTEIVYASLFHPATKPDVTIDDYVQVLFTTADSNKKHCKSKIY